MEYLQTYFVYIVQCNDDSYYTGITNDIERRIAEHNSGVDVKSYTYLKRPVELKYLATFQFVDQAIAFEKQIKGWSRIKKEALFISDWKKIIEISNEKNKAKKK
ncbi:MAG: GIY-YIG nuclease family protein [Chitinophagales bacterium]|nr:GIY-YIG nuclease family protein [Chitinophagales bacterium]